MMNAVIMKIKTIKYPLDEKMKDVFCHFVIAVFLKLSVCTNTSKNMGRE